MQACMICARAKPKCVVRNRSETARSSPHTTFAARNEHPVPCQRKACEALLEIDTRQLDAEPVIRHVVVRSKLPHERTDFAFTGSTWLAASHVLLRSMPVRGTDEQIFWLRMTSQYTTHCCLFRACCFFSSWSIAIAGSEDRRDFWAGTGTG
jgi:hypothetical protein